MGKRCQVVFWICLFSLVSAKLPAQTCSPVSGQPDIGYEALAGSVPGPVNCNGLACYTPELFAVRYETRPIGCDPSVATCSIRAFVPADIRGNSNNGAAFNGNLVFEWTSPQGQDAGSCGAGSSLLDEKAEGWIEVGGFTCNSSFDAGTFQFLARVCGCPPFQPICPCEETSTTSVDLTGPTIANAVCPAPPKTWSCSEGNSCQAGCMGPSGAGAGGAASGGAGAAGGGFGFGGAILGKAAFFYQSGGVGAPGNPLPSDWTALHGRFWSHEYAERIVPDPDDSHVWLLTQHATYREFTDADLDGIYETASPSDEYSQLTKTLNGWELRELDGMVHAFGLDGRWQSSTDRNDNAKTATYDAMDRLERVDFRDGRHELFVYDSVSGRLISTTEVGVDGVSTRLWSYSWAADDLTGISRPDGRSWSLTYDASGYLTRLTLMGDDGTSERIEGAWEYDEQGNVLEAWRGAADKDASGAVDRWTFIFDDPSLPVSTTVIDPLRDSSTHTFGRDSVSSKPRLEGISGDCPTSCAGANSSTSYSGTHALRPQSVTNGRGFITHMTYDGFGQLTSRTEAFGEPEERTTTWQYDATFPALVSRVERPSTTGDPMDLRITEYVRDANGNVTSELREGVESGSAFSYQTIRTYTSEGQLETVDGPGHGTDDLVTMSYDTALRGGLVLDSRSDPIIGTTTYGYDAFNRRTSMIDVNGVETITEYDPGNRVLLVRQKGAAGDGSEDLVTENRYNTFGDLFQVVLPKGNVIEYGYDSAGRLLSIERKPDDQPTSHGERVVYELNDFGQRTIEKHERWESGAWVERSRTVFTFGTRCHLDNITSGSNEQSVTEYAYDCNSNLEKIWDANHPSNEQMNAASTVYSYDALDRLATAEQPFGGAGGGTVTTSYGYDMQDHLVQVTDGEGTVTDYVFSDRSLMTRETSEVSGVTDYAYTESTQLETRTDARGITEIRTYDALDRITGVDYPDDSLDITYGYDAPGSGIGRPAFIARDGHSTDYAYDRFGRVTQDGRLGFEYDQNGNRTAISYPGGAMATYTFDFADREASLHFDDGNGQQSIVSYASYLPSGPLDGLILGNGLEEIRPYDTRYHPAEIRVVDGLSDLLHWQYTTDGVGNPTSIADLLDSANDRTYGYQDYQYFLTQGDGPWGTRVWTYDTIGSRLSEQKDNGFIETYAYQPNAAMTGNSPKLEQINVSGGVRSFQYDAAGNQTQVAAGSNVIVRTYDDAGRMSRQERAVADASADFLYDGRSFLRSAFSREPAAAGTEMFCDDFESGDTSAWGGAGGICLESRQTGPIYDSAGLLHGVDASKVLYFAGRPVALFETSPRFLTTDHLGTPVQATDGVKAVSWEGGFEPFGGDFSGASIADVFLGFAGQWKDMSTQASSVGTEIDYNVFRWYSPDAGRYLSVDPLGTTRPSRFGLLEAAEPYSYAASNSLFFVDPLGLRVVIENPKVANCYQKFKDCFPLFRSIAEHFENDRYLPLVGPDRTWTIKDPDWSTPACMVGGRRTETRTIWVPPERDCPAMMRCLFHEFYELWLIRVGGYQQFGPAGPADQQARHGESWIPVKRCCPSNDD